MLELYKPVTLEGMEDPFCPGWNNVQLDHMAKSEFNYLKSYQLHTFIVKSNDDLRQEVLAL